MAHRASNYSQLLKEYAAAGRLTFTPQATNPPSVQLSFWRDGHVFSDTVVAADAAHALRKLHKELTKRKT